MPSTDLGDSSIGKNLDFTAKWIPNGISTLDIRLSLTDISYKINIGKFARVIRYSGTYLATGKTSFNASIGLTKDYMSQSSGDSLPTQYGTDLYTTVALGVSYAPTINSQLACNASYQQRTASQDALSAVPPMSYPYHGTNFVCSAQLLLK